MEDDEENVVEIQIEEDTTREQTLGMVLDIIQQFKPN